MTAGIHLAVEGRGLQVICPQISHGDYYDHMSVETETPLPGGGVFSPESVRQMTTRAIRCFQLSFIEILLIISLRR